LTSRLAKQEFCLLHVIVDTGALPRQRHQCRVYQPIFSQDPLLTRAKVRQTQSLVRLLQSQHFVAVVVNTVKPTVDLLMSLLCLITVGYDLGVHLIYLHRTIQTIGKCSLPTLKNHTLLLACFRCRHKVASAMQVIILHAPHPQSPSSWAPILSLVKPMSLLSGSQRKH
jgi:hypothetical protein